MNINIIIAVCSLVLNIITILGGAIGFCILKFNDFSHMSKNFEKMESQLNKVLEKTTENEKNIAILTEISQLKNTRKSKNLLKSKRRKL
jgi:hypothetical protein